jgi:UDP-N-acetylmuramoylalanine--D-glutamate ligase
LKLEGRKVVVVGMARSGVAAVRLLQRHGALVRAVDEQATGEVLGIMIERQTELAFQDADLVVISPGVPADLELLNHARAKGIPVIGDLELAAPFLVGKTIGITGSNGKTTTTALTGHILHEAAIPCQVGGNIGTPPADMVETSRDDQWNVLELSSFQLETIEIFASDVALCLNVTPDHLDRHHTLEKYAAAKGRLFETQRPGDSAVLNADDPICTAYADLTAGQVQWFSLDHAVSPGAWFENGEIRLNGDVLMDAKEIPLRGRHNIENTMAASVAAHLAGASLPQIAAAIRTFPGVEHRLEFVCEIDGVKYYNDSKATNVDATLKAISAFDSGLWIILGGKDKDSDYRVLREPLHAKARAALLIGAAAQKIADHLGTDAVPIVQSGNLASAVQKAYRSAEPGDTVLLAPACASFDQFQNFEQRGRIFKELVLALAEGSQ